MSGWVCAPYLTTRTALILRNVHVFMQDSLQQRLAASLFAPQAELVSICISFHQRSCCGFLALKHISASPQA